MASNFTKLQMDHHKDQIIIHLKALTCYYQDSSLANIEETDEKYVKTIEEMLQILKKVVNPIKLSSASDNSSLQTPTPICQ